MEQKAVSNKFILFLYKAYTILVFYSLYIKCTPEHNLLFHQRDSSSKDMNEDSNHRKVPSRAPSRPTPVPRWSNESKIKELMRRTTLCEVRLNDMEERLLSLFNSATKQLEENAAILKRIEDLQEDIKLTHESTRLLVDAIDTM